MARERKKNKVKVDLASYPLYLVQGVPKVGKTSLMYELAQHVYGDTDAMELFSFLDEDGFNHLDGISFEELNHWKKVPKKVLKLNPDEISFIEKVDDIIENNDEYGIKMVVFDTFDKEVELGIEEIKRLHMEENGTPCKSLNDALGGYGRGRDRLLELMLEPVRKLRKAGIAVFVLAHTKFKKQADPLAETEYEQLTNNLRADIYAAYANIAQMIVTINIEKQVHEGKLIGEKRMMHFRSDGLIDCGCRFNEVPEKLELSAENFMLAFETGVKSSMKAKVTKKEIESRRKEELDNLKVQADAQKEEVVAEAEMANKINVEKNKTLLSDISGLFLSADATKKTKAKELVKKYGIKGFDDPNVETAHLEDILQSLE